jgi:phosphonate transport system ATP-binding protein
MISIRQLTKQFGDNPVLRGIDLQVGAGEFVVILGQSGAGQVHFAALHQSSGPG